MQIPADQVRAIATEIVNGDVWRNPFFYLVVVAISLISSVAGTFLSSYFGKRGEALATKADFDQVLTQLRDSTDATENIRAEIMDRYGSAAAARETLRDRLELMVMATFELEHWLEQARSRAIRGETSDFTGSPIAKIEALRLIYFPNVTAEFNTVNSLFLAQTRWILQVQADALCRQRGEDVATPHTDRFQEVHSPLLPALSAFRTRLVDSARQRGGL